MHQILEQLARNVDVSRACFKQGPFQDRLPYFVDVLVFEFGQHATGFGVLVQSLVQLDCLIQNIKD